MKTKDLLITGLIFGLIINIASNMYKDNRNYKLQKEVLDTKIETINFYNEAKEYIKILEYSRESLNDALDSKDRYIYQLENKDRLIKDLVRDR